MNSKDPSAPGERRGEDLVLTPQPMGKAAGEFKLVRAASGSAVFENAGDDRVSTISYAPADKGIVARVQYRADGRVEEFRLGRAP